ncbi:MAG TPA: phosphatase PAP2 family protein [Vicinamibacteria bacterium]|nr:phosphatase PAP2 family protein [Vicinamibacteria bacterium]
MNRIHATASAAVITLALVTPACQQGITQTEDLPPLAASSTDAGAGNWRMLVLSGPTQIAVPPPGLVTSDAYRAELTAIKAAQAGLTAEQREVVAYWSGGGVLRWNQILRELVARYNLPPAPRPDGTYPVPDATNPFADPQFPFANPPYAARAYSYVSVAQFEALKSAWYDMYLYNRPAPSRVDSGVQALANADVPAYPSADAVMSGVNETLMRLLFPAAVDEIARHAQDQRNAAVWSGKAAPSDVEAGVALGRSVAAVFQARAASDGMRTAGGSRAIWDGMAAAATARGEVAWASQETPPRPPMLPLFGQVRPWAMSSADIVVERPPAPPSTSSAQMKQELAEVKSYTTSATREQIAIANKWSDGAGTYTPPGHWNDIATEHIRDARMSEVRAARAYALLNMAMHDAAVGCWDAKYAYFNPRPSQLDPSIKTAIGLPNFPSYTSGHSTFSAAAAVVLSYLFPGQASAFDAMKEESSLSRLYSCIHYRSDIEVGKEHGRRIGGYTVRFAREDGAN